MEVEEYDMTRGRLERYKQIHCIVCASYICRSDPHHGGAHRVQCLPS